MILYYIQMNFRKKEFAFRMVSEGHKYHITMQIAYIICFESDDLKIYLIEQIGQTYLILQIDILRVKIVSVCFVMSMEENVDM